MKSIHRCPQCRRVTGVRVEVRTSVDEKLETLWLICPRCGDRQLGMRVKDDDIPKKEATK